MKLSGRAFALHVKSPDIETPHIQSFFTRAVMAEWFRRWT